MRNSWRYGEWLLWLALLALLLTGSEAPLPYDDESTTDLIEVAQEILIPPKQWKPTSETETPDDVPNHSGIVPTFLEIPKLNLKAAVENVGILPNGAMDTPKKDRNVGWLSVGTKPGNPGNAVMAGHVDNQRGAAVFYSLKRLQIGDEIFVRSKAGDLRTFVVRDKQVYRATKAPIDKIFGETNRVRLNLITCTGYFDRKLRTHLDRLVIYSELKK